MGTINIKYVTKISLVATLGGLLFGYDTAVISGVIGYLKTHLNLNPIQEGWAVSCVLVGCILGASSAGIISDKYGRKRSLLLGAAFFIISAIWSALSSTANEFVISRFIGGIGVGIASILSPLYLSEISPEYIRGRLVSYNQFAIIFGMLVVCIVNAWIAHMQNEEWNISIGWRWMLASEVLPALLFGIFLIFIPESPRWLVKQY